MHRRRPGHRHRARGVVEAERAETARRAVDLSAWQAVVSGNAQLVLTSVTMRRRPSLRLDYDFRGGGGFVVARTTVSRTMPEDFAVEFRLRGGGAVNDLELKLLDATGQNVWRHVEKNLAPPSRWKRITIPSEAIDFAWGPQGAGAISSMGSIELAIVAGSGGSGTLWISDLEIEDRTSTVPPRLSASTALPGFAAADALTATGWTPRQDDRRPWLVIDWAVSRFLGALIIDWRDQAPASGFRVRASRSGNRWTTVHETPAAGGRRSYVYLPALRTRRLRLELHEASSGMSLRVRGFEFSRSTTAFWNGIAALEKRGWHPRWLHHEQALWTPFGVADGDHCALLNEDGMVEMGQGSFSLEPMLFVGDRLVTWADVKTRQSLAHDWMPVPSVTWESAGWRLTITAQAMRSGVARVSYRLENVGTGAMRGRLFVLLRPFQVTPPWQSFRNLGGISAIHELRWIDGAVQIDRDSVVLPESADGAPVSFGALRFDDGLMPEQLAGGALPGAIGVSDPSGFATGAICFDFDIDADRCSEFDVKGAPRLAAIARDEPPFDWRSRLAVRQWHGHGSAQVAINAALTATAHVLLTRHGPALQPGPRRYTRSWIRDGAMMSAALLRMGHTAEVRDFIHWYAPHQRADGFVPCCVDGEGVDWLVEHDSHGELLALIADYWRFSKDDRLLAESWPWIEKAASFIEAAIEAGGLMPVSVSHEGYLAQPVHSFWDDFWTLRGMLDAAALAHGLGRESAALRWQALAERLSASLSASIGAVCSQRRLDYVPGSVEWADFDPTATANAIYLLDVPKGLDRDALERTFDRYLDDWRRKHRGESAWTNYTPYEIRNIGALTRLGRRSDALELLEFFLSDRRPVAWNQWPEIAWRDARAPAHLGDLPHTWIAAEYVLAVRCLFAYEREDDHVLIVAAGLAAEWLEGAGVSVEAMPTQYGVLSYSLRRLDAATLRFAIEPGFSGAIVLRPPLDAPLRRVVVDGTAIEDFSSDCVRVPRKAAEVICITSS